MERGPVLGDACEKPSSAKGGADCGPLPEQDSLTFTETLEQTLKPARPPAQRARQPDAGLSRGQKEQLEGARGDGKEEDASLCARLADTLLPEVVRQVGQKLRGELEAKAEDLREGLRAMSGTVTDKLRLLEEEREKLRSTEGDRLQASRSERSFLREALISPSAVARQPAIAEEEPSAVELSAAAAPALAAADAIAKCETVAEDARHVARKAEERAEQLEWRLKELLGRDSSVDPLAAAAKPGSASQRPPELAPEDSPRADEHSRAASQEGRLRTLEVDVQALRQLLHVPGVEHLSGVRPSGSAEAAKAAAWHNGSPIGSEERSLLLGQLEDAVGTLDAGVGGPQELLAEAASPASARVAPAPASAASGGRGPRLEARLEALSSAVDSLREQIIEAAATVEVRLEAVEESVRKVRERDVLGLKDDLRRLREKMGKAGGRPGALPSKSSAEPGERSGADAELRGNQLAAVWKEIASNAKAAAARADQLERGLTRRVDKAEATVGKIDQIEQCMIRRVEKLEVGISRLVRDGEAKTLAELSKQCEWLKWRVSWLEWSSDGEKRSFGRPAAEQASMEDAELWAREATGRQRPRRRLQPQRPLLQSQRSLQRVPSLEPLSPPERMPSNRNTRSHGRLPTLRL